MRRTLVSCWIREGVLPFEMRSLRVLMMCERDFVSCYSYIYSAKK